MKRIEKKAANAIMEIAKRSEWFPSLWGLCQPKAPKMLKKMKNCGKR